MRFPLRRTLACTAVAALSASPFLATSALAEDSAEVRVELVDSLTLPAEVTAHGLPFGGISGMDRLPDGRYVALSDDRSQYGPARFYVLDFAVDASGFAGENALDIQEMHVLRDQDGNEYAETMVDPEAIRVAPGGKSYWWSDEGDSRQPLNPRIQHTAADGTWLGEIEVPQQFLPVLDEAGGVVSGVRNNQAFENLAISPDNSFLAVMTESWLAQDDVEDRNLARFAQFDLATGENTAQYVYELPDRTFGATDMLQVSEDSFLQLERNWVDGKNTIHLTLSSTEGATDVSDRAAIDGTETPMQRTPLFTLDTELLGFNPDNVEDLAWGPRLADGRQTLMVGVDNNFNVDTQRTIFYLLAIDGITPGAREPGLGAPGTEAPTGEIPVTAQIPARGEGDTPADGALVLSIADGSVDLGEGRHAGDRLRLTGTLPGVTVTDSRSAGTWAVTGQSSALTTAQGAAIQPENLDWEPFRSAGDARPGDVVHPALAGGPGLSVPARLGAGAQGQAQLGADVRLEVPVDTAAGSYAGGLTVSLFPQD